MFASVTDWHSLVQAVDEIPWHIHGALSHLSTHHPRPALVEIPTDFLWQETEMKILDPRNILFGSKICNDKNTRCNERSRWLLTEGGGRSDLASRGDAVERLYSASQTLSIPASSRPSTTINSTLLKSHTHTSHHQSKYNKSCRI